MMHIKQLLILTVVFLNLISSASLADESFYDKANAERIKAAKNYARARILVVGIKRAKSIREKAYLTAIKKAEENVGFADVHLSKAREHLLKEYHSSDADEFPVKKLKQQLIKQRDDITKLKSSIEELHLSYTKKYNITVEDPKESLAVNDFSGWLDYIKLLRETESVKWTGSEVTKHLWVKAAGNSGFYGIHINNLASSLKYADDSKKISQEDYEYVRDGVKRFKGFHDQFIALLGKIKSTNDAGLEARQRWAEVSIRPYLSQKVFSGLPTRKDIPELPGNPAENLGYIPPQSMMQAFSELPKKPSLTWIKYDEDVRDVLQAFYDRGFALSFIKKFVNLGGKFKVEVTDDSNDNVVAYFPLDGTLFIPLEKYNYDRLKINPDLLADLLRELFHAYCDQIIDTNRDPLTRNLLVNTEIWLSKQFIRQDSNKSGSKAWWEFAEKIGDSRAFTRDYLGELIRVSFLYHMSIWNNLYQKSRDSRITPEKARTIWAQKENAIMNIKFLASDSSDSVSWEVQNNPPIYNFNYLNAFYGFGEY